jgi:hypothetical protein
LFFGQNKRFWYVEQFFSAVHFVLAIVQKKSPTRFYCFIFLSFSGDFLTRSSRLHHALEKKKKYG